MLFSSITFLYYFLPITMLACFLVPEKWKNAVLFAASFFFYFWGEPKYCLLMLGAVLTGYVGGIVISRSSRKGWTVFFTVLLLTALFVFKYSDFVILNFNTAAGSNLPLLKLSLPIGISFYTFQIISYLVDVSRGELASEQSFLRFGAYVTMFPQLIAGPIVRYSAIEREIHGRRMGVEKLSEGGCRFAVGLAKKVLIADVLSELVTALNGVTEKDMLAYWGLAVAFALQIYYDFSGYSDMAIGLGKMLGFTFPENFKYPFTAKSITEFWKLWHITLGSWFRDYVYIPLGGNRVPLIRWICNVLAVWLLSGLWHGAGWNFAVWGLYFSVFLILEKIVRMEIHAAQSRSGSAVRNIPEHKKRKMKAASPVIKFAAGVLRHMYTVLVVVISFVIFREEELAVIWENLRGMFGGGSYPGTNPGVVYELKSYALLLTAAAAGTTPWLRRLTAFMDEEKVFYNMKEVLQPFIMLALLIACTAYLIGSSAHPFLYFRF